jgi:hypothetical protein
VLTRIADVGTVDMRLFESFSSDDARQKVARRIVAQARVDLDRGILDPELRKQTEQNIERVQALSSGSTTIPVN